MMTGAFPKPGRALKAVLAVIGASALAGAIVVNWAPGPPVGQHLFEWLAFEPDKVLTRPWTLLTSGVLTNPIGIMHALWSLLGLYFLTTDLEDRWGAPRLLRFLAASVIVGNLTVLAAWSLPLSTRLFHPAICFGPIAAITATAIAWSKENRDRKFLLFFVLPLSGRTLFWLTLGISVLSLVFQQGTYEGAVAPLGGVFAGMLFGGNPSPVRSVWLRLKLALLRRKAGGGLTVESITGGKPSHAARPKRSSKGPPLRVVYGGLEDELKNRKPPKDKRYLN